MADQAQDGGNPSSTPSNNEVYNILKWLKTSELNEIITQCNRTDGSATEKLAYIVAIVLRSYSARVVNDRLSTFTHLENE